MLSTILDFLIYNLLISSFGLSASNSKRISFLSGTLNSFIFNKKITFKSKNNTALEAIKYFSVWIVSFFINSITHDIVLVYYDGYVPFISGSLISICINFLGAKFWVFKK